MNSEENPIDRSIHNNPTNPLNRQNQGFNFTYSSSSYRNRDEGFTADQMNTFLDGLQQGFEEGLKRAEK